MVGFRYQWIAKSPEATVQNFSNFLTLFGG